jgi:hypothetical protein
MPPVGFEPTISAGERLQTYVLDCAPTETGFLSKLVVTISSTKYLFLNVTTVVLVIVVVVVVVVVVAVVLVVTVVV